MRLQTESKPSGFVPATGLSTRRGFVLGTLGGTFASAVRSSGRKTSTWPGSVMALPFSQL